ncbi:MAG: ABC transporter permease [Bryobacteraceae bacterium]|jgi:putative ABC transport system permease protein
MSIPLAYNLRNLVVRKTTTIMTALGIGLTVAVLLAILMMVNGLRSTLAASGDPLNVLVMRHGSDSELVSNFTRTQFQDLKFKAGIAAGPDGQPLASLELVSILNLASVDNPQGNNLTVRGLLPVGQRLRPSIHLMSGRWFEAGKPEMVVGKSIAARYPDAQIGKKIAFGRSQWLIVGVMDAGTGAQNSEIWADLNQLSSDMNRLEVLSSALVRAPDAVTAKALVNDIENDQKLGLHAIGERDYYDQQTDSAKPVEYAGIFVAIVMAIGSSFAAMNTMYAAVARRAREIGTLRVLGFSKGSILLSFFLESVLLSALGGVVGCLLVLPFNGYTSGIGNSSFSETAFAFRATPPILAMGLGFAIVMGCLGGFFPAQSAARKQILTALRES